MVSLVRAWARIDPRTAEEVVRELKDQRDRKQAFPALIVGVAESGDPEVWRYLARMGVGFEREQATVALLRQQMLTEGVEATIRTIDELSDEPPFPVFKSQSLRTAVGILARSDPVAASAIVQAHRDHEAADNLLRRLIVNWVTQDGHAAMAWLLKEPDTKNRQQVMHEAYRRWIMRDRAAALAWMAGIEDYTGVESITDIYATALARSDLKEAIAWAEALEDEAAQREALLDIGEVWRYRDPEAADEWLREVELHDALMEKLGPRRRKARAAGRVSKRADSD
jgi:hypothetical protein